MTSTPQFTPVALIASGQDDTYILSVADRPTYGQEQLESLRTVVARSFNVVHTRPYRAGQSIKVVIRAGMEPELAKSMLCDWAQIWANNGYMNLATAAA